MLTAALGLFGALSVSQAPPAEPPAVAVTMPDLDRVRYRDPVGRREIWLGAEMGGAALPESFGLFNRRVWTLHATPSWAVALTPWLAIGGRHSVILYDAVNIRLREHDHTVEVSAQTLAIRRGQHRFVDRLAVGVSTHAIKKSTVDGLAIKPGGLNDTILTVGYGLSHVLPRRFRLGWRVQARHAWVFKDTQRQVRAAIRASVRLGRGHRLSLQGIGYLVHRDADQAGNPLPRTGVYGQVAADWTWLSRYGVGPMLRARFLSSFRSGEAPAYEIREEALNTVYGELIAGVRAVWR
ncbi:MAG: hypothetical protein AAF721_13655 [Myxococcota bacterium]